MATISLNTNLDRVLGDKTAKEFVKSFGIETVRQLLEHAPRRYQKRGELTPLFDLPLGETVTVFARVEAVQERPMRNKKGSILEVTITDGPDRMKLTWFNQAWRNRELKPGVRGMFSGKVTEFRDVKQLSHPDYDLIDEAADALAANDPLKAQAWAMTPVPIYPATAKLRSWVIDRSVNIVLDALTDLDDPLPFWVLEALKAQDEWIMSIKDAYEAVHRPQSDAEWRLGRQSLKFREAFELQLGLAYRKEKVRALTGVPRPKVAGGYLDRFDDSLPYTLTSDQKEVGDVIATDMASGSPMHRLLQGEVGSGKTLVALRAMLQIADLDGQAALLAPTEVLASQHLRSITELLGEELTKELHPTLLTGQLGVKEKKSALLALASGKAKIVIGTHALMSENVTFTDLGLIVIDEQHRFGVEQREALRRKGQLPPHVLVMTATPIPRTIALTAFGDLEFSTLKKMPAGRAKITTHVVPLAEHPHWLERAWGRAAEEIESGRQVYVVCPAIREKETEGVPDTEGDPDEAALDLESSLVLANVEETLANIQRHPVLGKIASHALTGEMPSDEKDATMRSFADGSIKLLVATTVIEVGVNVPNASMMIVLDADRFGVSQLHQLRGRVGRGEHAGLCLFVTEAQTGTPARARVEAVASTLD
ncbi:MAG TPA: ATP-dependent DNA helicase RecG, partial [Microbacteriaceae bacterium]|nr:ATP-dependent DNA helicase RecG [Microbacteriaceae bacterium]